MKKKTKENIGNTIIVILLIGFMAGAIYFLTRPPKTTTACGWENIDGENVWVCREYRRIFIPYKGEE